MSEEDNSCQEVVQEVCRATKYADVCEQLISRIAATELAKGRTRKDVVKATKRRLHQVAGAFVGTKPDYTQWLTDVRSAAEAGAEQLQDVLRGIMAYHASTRERLDFVAEFYSQSLDDLGEVNCVLDLACGLNPLAVPWMHLTPGTRYVAVDIYEPLMDFIAEVLRLLGLRAETYTCDICDTDSLPRGSFDVVLLLKAVPCLMQIDRSCPRRLFTAIDAKELLVSFPGKSLGGNEKGMKAHYGSVLRDLTCDKNWVVRELTFRNETLYRITKPAGSRNS